MAENKKAAAEVVKSLVERTGIEERDIVDMMENQGYTADQVVELAESYGFTPEQKKKLRQEKGLTSSKLKQLGEGKGRLHIFYNEEENHIAVVEQPKFRHIAVATRNDGTQGPEFLRSLFLEAKVWESDELTEGDLICYAALMRQINLVPKGSLEKL